MKIFLNILYFLLVTGNSNPENFIYSEVGFLSQKWETVQEIDADFDTHLGENGIKGKVDPDSISVSVIGEDGKPNVLRDKHAYIPGWKKLFLKVDGEENDDISFKKYRIYFRKAAESQNINNETECPEQQLLPANDQYLFRINKISQVEEGKRFFPFEIKSDYKDEYILLTTLPSQNSDYCFRALPSSYEFNIRIAGKNLDPKVWKLRAVAGWWSESEHKFLGPFHKTTFAEIKGVRELGWTTFKKIFTPPPDTDYVYIIVYINKMNSGGSVWLDKPQIKMIDVMNLDNLFMEKKDDFQ